MDSYLAIARRVLSEARQPLSAVQILRAAYDLQIVPRNLYGKTQHKTLQARIAVDILRNRGRSDFVRTERGRFFLRSLFSDPNIRRRLKGEYLAPLRADQLKRFHVTCFARDTVQQIQSSRGHLISLRDLCDAPVSYRLLARIEDSKEICFLRVFVIVTRGDELLLHRMASRLENPLDGKLSIGLIGYVKREDRTLFATDSFGIQEAAERTLSEQLYMPYEMIKELSLVFDLADTKCLVDIDNIDIGNTIVAVVVFGYPADERFDQLLPSLHSLEWHAQPTGFNDLQRFDRWSKYIIEGALLRELFPRRLATQTR
ncbi:winged helix-turn-helix domain-containing protein [Bradyrhizobium sp. CCBAU 53415]|uniref:winged helix-turn-helix domain-containing protein n=1 Tax=Bradyrhizobium sp. CCBAU 53415 TaxID=1325119 RepID=UPI0023063029|nr:winged helix-turn-helix domain-containing protein [Bradyrhizobium sp. CCBAU 53415]MDA9466605.1 hypothetical protein [Bradyrhizobium sp. CCBAU 53415]